MRTFFGIAALALGVGGSWGSGAWALQEMEQAPPAFGYRDGTVVPIDIQTVDLDLVFDYGARKAHGHAVVVFDTETGGFPMLDMVPEATAIRLDGVTVSPTDFPVISDPDQVTRFRVLKVAVPANSRHTLEVDYELDSSDVTYSSGRVRVGFFMSDLTSGGRAFFEQYGPANYEFDQIKYTFDVRIEGTSTAHRVFTNGATTETAANTWHIDFPDYFTTSSLYFHLSEEGRFQTEEFTLSGMHKDIPGVVYASSRSLVNQAVSRAHQYMAELEGTYGPYLHERLVIYVTDGGGGMEYGGATMTSLGAQGHEMTHFWFARGVMPNNANSGWIDEAIASWRDDGYPRASGAPNRSAVNLGGFSPYRRHTSYDAYSKGAQLISEFDYLFRSDGGMKPVLRNLFGEHGGETITVGIFQSFLERVTGVDLESIFQRYVFGRTHKKGFLTVAPERLAPEVGPLHHPRPYTREELALYR